MRNPLPQRTARFSAVVATVFALLPFIPLVLIFLVAKAPDRVKDMVVYTVPLAALGSPGVYILDRFGGAGLKFVMAAACINWAIYFVICFALTWPWFALRGIKKLPRGVGR